MDPEQDVDEAPAVELKVRADGPYKVTGPIRLVDADGEPIPIPPDDRGRALILCRCGQSATKPFCDQTHKRVGFRG